MKRVLKNQDGMALVMVLILAAISLAIMASLVMMLTSSTQISGIEKRYKTATEAGKGGLDVFYQFMDTRGDPAVYNPLIDNAAAAFWALKPGATDIIFALDCSGTSTDGSTKTGLAAKMLSPSATWGGTNCLGRLNNQDIAASYDMFIRFDAGVGSTYDVYAKIVDTVEGNTISTSASIVPGDNSVLGGGSVVNQNAAGEGSSGGSGGIAVVKVPYVYSIEIEARNRDNAAERAKYSVLYQF